jgi:hypothetical protein
MRGRLAEAGKHLVPWGTKVYEEAGASPMLNVWAVPSADV